MLEFTLRRKIARVIIQLAETLEIDKLGALTLFYSTRTCQWMHDPSYGIHYQSDTCIVNDIIAELRERQG